MLGDEESVPSAPSGKPVVLTNGSKEGVDPAPLSVETLSVEADEDEDDDDEEEEVVEEEEEEEEEECRKSVAAIAADEP